MFYHLFFRKIRCFKFILLSLLVQSTKMRDLVAKFPDQLKKAIEIGENAVLKPSDKTFSNVLICGLGGSGIGARIFAELIDPSIEIPVFVNGDYSIPNWVDKNTLVVISSYSGNTEEVVSCLDQAKNIAGEICSITSGGKVLEESKREGYNVIEIPGDMPPRTCLGYSLTQFFFLFHHYGLIEARLVDELRNSYPFLESLSSSIEEKARSMYPLLNGKVSVLYSSQVFNPLMVRFQQQINENSKALAWVNVVPEMNHNEIVGWTQKNDQLAVVAVEDDQDNNRVLHRLDYVRRLVSPLVSSYSVIKPEGKTLIEKYFYLTHMFDWISVQIAEAKGIDAVEVNVITRLKEELAEID